MEGTRRTKPQWCTRIQSSQETEGGQVGWWQACSSVCLFCVLHAYGKIWNKGIGRGMGKGTSIKWWDYLSGQEPGNVGLRHEEFVIFRFFVMCWFLILNCTFLNRIQFKSPRTFRYSSLSSYVSAIHSCMYSTVLRHLAILLPISFLEHTLFYNNETVSRNLVVRSWYIFNWRTPLKNESMMKYYLVPKEKKK